MSNAKADDTVVEDGTGASQRPEPQPLQPTDASSLPPRPLDQARSGCRDSGYYSFGSKPKNNELYEFRFKAGIGDRGGNAGNAGSPPEQPETSQTVHEPVGGLQTGADAMAVDDRIIKRLKNKNNTGNGDKKGLAYVFGIGGAHPTDPVVKIGSTGDKLHERINSMDLQGKHRLWTFDPTPSRDFKPERLYKITEYLAQAEFHCQLLFGKNNKCVCEMVHREYFGLEAAAAVAAVSRWQKFCASEPFDKTGMLRPFWAHRLERRIPPGAAEKATDHAARGRRWDRFVDATPLDYLLYDVERLVRAVRLDPHRWRWCSVAQAATCLLLPGSYASTASVLVFVYLFLDASAIGRKMTHCLARLVEQDLLSHSDEEKEVVSLAPWINKLLPASLISLMPRWLALHLPEEQPRWLARCSSSNLNSLLTGFKSISTYMMYDIDMSVLVALLIFVGFQESLYVLLIVTGWRMMAAF
jgi:hypothetical protein